MKKRSEKLISRWVHANKTLNASRVMGLRMVATMLVSKSRKVTQSYILLNLFTLPSSRKSFLDRNTTPIMSVCY